MHSMTGHGRGTAVHEGTRATVELRAVNHRFIDLKLRGAALSPAIEDAVASRIRQRVERGAITAAIQIVHERAVGGLRVDHDAARHAYEMLADTATRLGLPGPDLALVIAQPGVIVPADERGDDPPVLPALDAALAELDRMRATEGQALAAELDARLTELAALRVTLAGLAAGVPQQLARRLTERVRRAVDDAAVVDPTRLAQEVALLADRTDVTEELVRLASHLDQARALLAATGPVGRRLDFLVQELGRELNTIGSKSALAEITSAVVEAKAVLEKIREQAQNVE